jgi:hypothetical protein
MSVCQYVSMSVCQYCQYVMLLAMYDGNMYRHELIRLFFFDDVTVHQR